MERRDNYAIQAQQAKKLFLTYDQQELISRCRLHCDEAYFYLRFLGAPYRIARTTGDMERLCGEKWVDGNSFAEVMTVLDWLCDSRKDRYISGQWVNIVTQSSNFHRNLQESRNPAAEQFDRDPEGFCRGCLALGGKPHPSGDIAYTVELLDGLSVLVQLWRGDEEFPPSLRLFWDKNVLNYIRYETTWYAADLLVERIGKYAGE